MNKTSTDTNLLPIRFYNGDKQILEIKAEVADTIWKQAIGLMNRTNLPEDQGMLFIFDSERKREFWMKNTIIPLDMIFLDKDFKIVNIIKNAQPCKSLDCEFYSSTGPARYVIEINGGLSSKYNITNQTKISW
ncbi:DUF192 domain-containing protein [Candidatus Pacearchaeota archaeon]|nr:DUF192 domain-containing protein [Candidatus Pacearchaeota archaeon]